MAADAYLWVVPASLVPLADASRAASDALSAALSVDRSALAALSEAADLATARFRDALVALPGPVPCLHLCPLRADGPRLSALYDLCGDARSLVLGQAVVGEFTRALQLPNTSAYWRNSYLQRVGADGYVHLDMPHRSARSPRRQFARGPVRLSDFVRFARAFWGCAAVITHE